MSEDTPVIEVPDEEVFVPDDNAPDSDLEKMVQIQLQGELDEENRPEPTGERLDQLDEPRFRGISNFLSVAPPATGTASQMGARAIAWANTKVGLKEKPAYSNHVPIWEDMKPAWQGSPWCAAFATDAWARVGVDLRKVVGNPYYCPSLEAMAKKYGAWQTYGSGYSPKAGDISLMGRRGYASHAGLAAPTSGNYSGYRQIEGNTSSSNSGSQTNGDGVYVRYRTDFIRGWINMAKLVAALVAAKKLVIQKPGTRPRPTTSARPPISLSRTLEGITGKGRGKFSGNVRIIQGLLHKQSNFKNTIVNGVWTADSAKNYAAYQRVCGYKGSDADGIPGMSTFKRLVEWGGYRAVK